MIRVIECSEDVHHCHRVYVFRRHARCRAELKAEPYLPDEVEDDPLCRVRSSDEDVSARTMAERHLKLVSFSTFGSWSYNYGHHK